MCSETYLIKIKMVTDFLMKGKMGFCVSSL